MDLTARKKKQNAAQPRAVQANPEQTTQQVNTYTHSITVRYSSLLYTTLQNMVIAAHTANDFTYTSVADIVRAALQAYRDGMELTETDEPGVKKQTSIRINSELQQFYKSWPNQMRTKILERAIRTFLKQL